jgi:hypothetical protein
MSSLTPPFGPAISSCSRTTKLLSGLSDRDIVYVAHVVRVIRQRLERDSRAMARQGAIR